ncbi:hypothetical protein NBRC116598_39600 [Pseudophaeobacter arcticus]|uniref:Uncharacterized protein n=1 Tax=Pseudophaeobacter arcticus TaxID=385492 RepID=A0ABQ0ARN7_9RHOB
MCLGAPRGSIPLTQGPCLPFRVKQMCDGVACIWGTLVAFPRDLLPDRSALCACVRIKRQNLPDQ